MPGLYWMDLFLAEKADLWLVICVLQNLESVGRWKYSKFSKTSLQPTVGQKPKFPENSWKSHLEP